MADMMGMMLRGMGVDPDVLMGQAKGLGTAFETMVKQQEEILAALSTLQASHDALSAALGIYVPPPTPKLLELIEEGSKPFFDPARNDERAA